MTPVVHVTQCTPVSLPSQESEREVAQSCPTVCDPLDCSPPGSSVHGILQARTLEWVAMFSYRGLSPCNQLKTVDIGGNWGIGNKNKLE